MSPLTTALLTDVLLKATLGLGLAALLAAALGRASAATRHLVWTLGVATALLLPALRGIAPRWELPLLPATASSTVVVRLERLVAGVDRPAAAKSAGSVAHAAGTAGATPGLPAEPASPPRLETRALLGLFWLAGSVLVGLPLLVGAARVSWHARRTSPFASAAWSALVKEVAASIGLARPVRLLRARAKSMPMAAGLLHPAVLLPEDAEGWPAPQRRTVLTHELGHVKRHDCLTQALAHTACAVYWFHPLAWVAAWRLRVERERACDDLVLRAGASGPDYADQLLQLARQARASAGPAWALAMARPSQLEGRLLAILDPSRERRGPSRGLIAATALAAALLAVLLAGLQPWATPVSASTTLALDTLGPDAIASSGPAPPQDVKAPRPPERSAVTPAPDRPARSAKASSDIALALAEAVRDSDAEVRAQAVRALGGMRSGAAVDALGQALASDTEAEVRQQAAFALGEIRDARAVPALTAALADTDADVREQVVFALGELRAQEAVAPLARALKDAQADVRKQAAFALGEIRAAQAVPALVEALQDASPDVREQAAFALGEIGDESASEPLLHALKDSAAGVRRQAAFALGQLAGGEGGGLDPNPNPNPNPNPHPRP